MLTKDEIQHKIDYEIIIDCYDEYEASMGWYYYMEEKLKFPFKAKAKLKESDGSFKLTEIQVTGLAADEEGFTGNDFNLEILLGGYVTDIAYTKLSGIKADDQSLEVFTIWNYWNRKQL